MHYLVIHWKSWALSAGILAGSILVALLFRWILFAIIDGLTKREPTLLKDSIVRHSKNLARWILPLLAVVLAVPALPLPGIAKTAIQHAVGLALIGVVGWLVILVTDVVIDVFETRYRVDTADNLVARKVQTQLNVLRRILDVLIIFITVGVALMTFPAIHQIGTSLLASAGVAGIVVGLAMKPTLSSLVAGIQIALTQPIRIDDVVVVDNEWGRIEEIHTFFVVVRIWDLRRLVVPLTYFIEQPFENWTRTSADLLAYVLLWVDYSVPVDELRQEFTRLLETTPKWKGQVNVLQVVDANDHAIQVRALMDAPDSGQAWDLKCVVREGLIKFLQEKYPNSLPRYRGEVLGGFSEPTPPNGRIFGPPVTPQQQSV
ncbi:MAG TPA: mechanosensitive ion channel domain-containing protein [Candidatus Dormibacteraeota bacterium]|nr:mechanosensitive ion channel domain-containing protein [Candidatus Dormibacteraeota bacterium]